MNIPCQTIRYLPRRVYRDAERYEFDPLGKARLQEKCAVLEVSRVMHDNQFELRRDDGWRCRVDMRDIMYRSNGRSGMEEALVEYADYALPPYGAPTTPKKEPKDMSIDNVTLLQIAAGVTIWSCRFESGGKDYHYKAAPGALFAKGERVLASGDKGYAVVAVIGQAGEFEPLPGVVYQWITPLDTSPLDRLVATDKAARNKLRLGSAIRDAQAAAAGIDGFAVLPPALSGPASNDSAADLTEKVE